MPESHLSLSFSTFLCVACVCVFAYVLVYVRGVHVHLVFVPLKACEEYFTLFSEAEFLNQTHKFS